MLEGARNNVENNHSQICDPYLFENWIYTAENCQK